MQDTAAVIRDTFGDAVDLMFISSNDGGIGQHIVEAVRPLYGRASFP